MCQFIVFCVFLLIYLRKEKKIQSMAILEIKQSIKTRFLILLFIYILMILFCSSQPIVATKQLK